MRTDVHTNPHACIHALFLCMLVCVFVSLSFSVLGMLGAQPQLKVKCTGSPRGFKYSILQASGSYSHGYSLV